MMTVVFLNCTSVGLYFGLLYTTSNFGFGGILIVGIEITNNLYITRFFFISYLSITE